MRQLCLLFGLGVLCVSPRSQAAQIEIAAPPTLRLGAMEAAARPAAALAPAALASEKAPAVALAAPLAQVQSARPDASPEAASALIEALYSGQAQAQSGFLGGYEPPAQALRPDDHFINPNERRPSDAREILEQSPGGLYVAVGTERGFIGAALADGITHLLLIDRNPLVTAYNRINIALLQLAKDRREYNHLRRKAGHDKVLELAQGRNLSPAARAALEDRADWLRWEKAQAESELRSSWFTRDFAGANYLKDGRLFKRLKTLAEQGRIKAFALDLTNEAAVSGLVQALKPANVPLGVLDLSNAWVPGFMGMKRTLKVVEAFQALATERAILMLTEQTFGWGFGWNYFGFRFGDLRRSDAAHELEIKIGGELRDSFRANEINALPNNPRFGPRT